MLAGVRFDGQPGLPGHSDADVACHALAEAMLGAAALGDLGTHLPDDDPATEGLAGLELLGRIGSLVADAGLRLESCDLTVLAARPAIAPRREEMRRSLARTLDAEVDRVAQQLAAGPQRAFAMAKELLNQAAGIDQLDAHLDREIQELARIADGPEFAEGLAAFFDKRAPTFV